MPTRSPILASIRKYETLTAANFYGAVRPPIFLWPAPPVGFDGLQLYPPYVVLRDRGAQIKPADMERSRFAACEFTFEVYGTGDGTTDAGLAVVAQNVEAIRLNGGTVGQGLGFDYGTLDDLIAPRSTHQILQTRELYQTAPGIVSKTGQPVYVCFLDYKLTLKDQA